MTSTNLETASARTDKALSVADVSEVTTLSVSSIWDMSRKGLMPAPFKVSRNRTCWSSQEIQHWLAERKQSARVAA